ncbi:hypothetical protein G6539_33910, partial [Streptomyces albidoflavus]|nr:hypothetical protein [Streptomyces albidoflavus]
MTGHLGDGDLRRISRSGARALSSAEGVALLDLALTADVPLLLPAPIDLAAVRARATEAGVPSLLAARHAADLGLEIWFSPY